MVIEVTKWGKVAFALTIALLIAFSSNHLLSSTIKESLQKYHDLQESVNQTEADIQYLKDQLVLINNKINLTKKQLTFLDLSLEENLSVLKDLQEGDEYELHDPLYEEVKAFVENDTSKTIEDEIHHAKHLGMRCAYTQVIISNEGMYELIAFDTVDKGMVYFEPVTDFEVKPEIGKNYTECVIGQPYVLENDTITDIITVW